MKIVSRLAFTCCIFILSTVFAFHVSVAAEREMISLNGDWKIAEGSLTAMPTEYYSTVKVPGLADLAAPQFTGVGQKSNLREAFWYQRKFKIESEIPTVAQLIIYRAKYGIKVFLNGHTVGESTSCFTQNSFDVAKYLRGNDHENILVIRVGAFYDVLPKNEPWGNDWEKVKYIPGIYDDVELILTETPHVVRAQLVPDIKSNKVRIVADVENAASIENKVVLTAIVKEKKSGKIVGTSKSKSQNISAGQQQKIDFDLKIEACQFWTPEDPFLYDIEIRTDNDIYKDTFGMRSFRFDAETGRAMLNEKPYFMRGTNICIFRFFETSEREELPWNQEWARNLHLKIKDMHWNSMRYCIGFPPRYWYKLCDELGILIQNEYPIWGREDLLDKDILVREFTKMMQEYWNHPCVVIWDAQNETITNVTGEAIQEVRHLDLSNRPWDNGWSEPQQRTDCNETHPYQFVNYIWRTEAPEGALKEFLVKPQIPGNGPTERCLSKQNFDDYPTIINEYGWLWLNRDGSPTTITKFVYEKLNMEGLKATPEQRFEVSGRFQAALTEYWRAHRTSAGVLHFCYLGYSRPSVPKGQTCDHFSDVENLVFEKYFEGYVKDAFSPIGLMIDVLDKELDAGTGIEAPVFVINDYDEDHTVSVRIRIEKDNQIVFEESGQAEVQANGREMLKFEVTLPKQSGDCWLVAEIASGIHKGVRSTRKINVN